MKEIYHRTLEALLTSTLVLGALSSAALAEETEKPSADVNIALYSKYVWRGFELSKDSLVIQPSVTASYMGFGFNLWGNLDTDQDLNLYGEEGGNWNETDMTLSYDNSLGIMSYSVGYIYYALQYADDSQEVYGSISLDTIMAPSLTIYRDIARYPGWYTALKVSHTFDLSETITVDLGGHISYLSIDDESYIADPDDPTSAYSDFHDGQVFVTVGIPVTEYITVVPELYYSFPLSSAASDIIKVVSSSGDDDNFVYGGISLNMAF